MKKVFVIEMQAKQKCQVHAQTLWLCYYAYLFSAEKVTRITTTFSLFYSHHVLICPLLDCVEAAEFTRAAGQSSIGKKCACK